MPTRSPPGALAALVGDDVARAVPRRQSSARTCHSTRPRPPARCRRWPTGSPSSCPGTRASIVARAGSRSSSTAAYEDAREAMPRRSPAAPGGDDVAIICRNTTEAINHLAYRLAARAGRRRRHHGGRAPRQPAPVGALARGGYVECGADGTFDVDAVVRGARRPPRAAAAGHHRRVERHRLAPAARRDHRRRPRARRAGRSSTPPSSPPTGRCRAGADFVVVERPQDVRAVRRRRR